MNDRNLEEKTRKIIQKTLKEIWSDDYRKHHVVECNEDSEKEEYATVCEKLNET